MVYFAVVVACTVGVEYVAEKELMFVGVMNSDGTVVVLAVDWVVVFDGVLDVVVLTVGVVRVVVEEAVVVEAVVVLL